MTDETKPSEYRLKIPQQMTKTNYENEFKKKEVEHKPKIIVNEDYETEFNIKGPHTFTTNYSVNQI